MQRMGLVSVLPWIDTRSRFLGHQVDYIFVRGLEVVYAEAPEVESSDHNPVLATLRVADAQRNVARVPQDALGAYRTPVTRSDARGVSM
jgi:hypothetical protein